MDSQNLGVAGYAVFSGLQQLVVITGLHHIFGAIEAQLLADTGRNFLNPPMSVAIIALILTAHWFRQCARLPRAWPGPCAGRGKTGIRCF
ncbi:hypothetical protein AALB53_15355 [Lachnospiraceae bacterium 47-T17]